MAAALGETYGWAESAWPARSEDRFLGPIFQGPIG
jgi:hypothetical protein